MTFGLVLVNDASLDLLGFVLIAKAEQNETEAAASLCEFLAHHNRVLDLAKVLEVILEMLLTGGECESTHEQFNLVLLSGLMEGGR